MKGFIITVCLFITLVACIILNYSYVNKVHDNMHQMVNELTQNPSEQNAKLILKLKEYWNNKNALLSISVSYREIDNLSNALDSLSAANQSANTVQFLIYKELTQNAIDAIMRLERISIKNIF